MWGVELINWVFVDVDKRPMWVGSPYFMVDTESLVLGEG